MTADERFDRIEKAIEGLELEMRQGFSDVRKDMSQLREYVLDFRQEVVNRFDVIGGQIGVLSANVASFDSRLSGP
jgi:hypothetical protein